MGQIMAVDYGKARTGLAVTDDMQIIASALQTVETPKLMDFLGSYFQQNRVDEIVVGLPTDLKGNMSEIETEIQKFLEKFQTTFPQIKINRFDERFTSKMASFFISQSGKSKKERQQKGLIDKVSATLILQNFLETR
ncbi:Holliday junction resolvase RuvX [Elizabethkingia anophelis]|uniref:Putative pre-16S rRNA nuclease n=3 Tax=Elizabethkingia anophelis TaxID=1117645 RepID=X5KBT3_9FLAO|nr:MULTISPECIES: Holliday junction resolvase RuvX [Elizabethkingia]AIL44562.1 Putative Holliday junction resolvase [Elizabethkingia anophelis NUHP1]AKH93379.1 Holliday junction resolvase [Elizabethkingia anophelis FMS-007]AMR42877.1 crossover junction endodeoxyribonuclease RuvA [Elizabethkingia anophelis]AMX49520.1 crossover junction endodeoxyribonuclease RuvA [Elizabethkingia anophelis]AMX52975.1 crossover junction endodeoxyribonuclease RuvA [Elizabethkingia anophelis]